jgi:HlyD family secretion protein
MNIPWFGKKNKRMVWLLLALAAIGIVAALVNGWRLSQSSSKVNLETLTVAAKAEELTVRLTASGSVAPAKTVNLSPKTAGRVAELFVEQGDFVQAGQLIARMENADLLAQRAQLQAGLVEAEERVKQLREPARNEVVLQAEADIAKAEGEIARSQGLVEDAKSALGFAQRQLERQQDLADQGAIARNALDEFIRRENAAQATLTQSQAQLAQAIASRDRTQQQAAEKRKSGAPSDIRQAEARVAAAAAQVQQVDERLNDTLVRAPFAGQVSQRYANEGAFVTPTTQASAAGSGASSTSIVAIASALEVVAKVPEVDIGQIKRGQAVEVRVDAFPKESFQGRVRLIAPEAIEERDVKFFQVRISLITGKDKLRSGMNADLAFVGEQLKEALVVPTVAIVTKKGKTGVLIPDQKSQPQFKPVTIGINQGDQTQILAGIESGDRVFVQLPEGKKLDEVIKDEDRK